MSKTVRIIAGAAIAAVGVVTMNPQLIITGVMMSATALLQPKIKQQERQAAVTSLTIGETSREALLGEGLTGGSLADGFNWGGKYGTDWEGLIIDLADHECQQLVGFMVNDQYVAFAGDGMVAGYNNQLQVYFRSGTESQSLPAIVTANAPGWTANDRGRGICYVVVAYKADAAEAQNPVWPSGRPAFRWRVKGKRCYDPRKDSTVAGGAGAHRWTLPATWEWTDNPIICRYNWVRGIFACDRITDPTMLLVGRGLSAIEAPPENVFAAANLCDELVSGEKRYRIGGVVRADEPFINVEEMFAAACGGVIVQPQGSVEIEPGQAKSPVAYITDDDLVVGSTVSFSKFLSRSDGDWYNTVVPRYIEPAQNWADHGAPIRRLDADVIADGGPREEVLSLPLVTNAKQAGRVGEIKRRFGRLWKRATITLGPRFAELEEADWIVWTSQRYLGGASVTFRADTYSLSKEWQNTLSLREITSSVFSEGAFIADGSTATQPGAPPSVGTPGAGAWALASALLTDSGGAIPALVITGAVDDTYAQAIRFEYWKSDGVTPPASVTNWNAETFASPATTRVEITSLAPGAVYYTAVSYVVNGIPGTRRILGPVTAGVITSGSFVGAGDLALLDSVYFGSPYILEAGGGATATLSNFRTSLGTAAGFVGQGAVASLNLVGASYLVLPDTANLLLDPILNDTAYWLNTLWTLTDSATGDAFGNQIRFYLSSPVGNGTTSQADSIYGSSAARKIAVEAGKPYRVAARGYVSAGFTGVLFVSVAWYKADGTTLAAAGPSYVLGPDHRTVAAGAGLETIEGFVTAPSDAKWAVFRSQLTWSTTLANAGRGYMTAPAFQRAIDADLAADRAFHLNRHLAREDGTTYVTDATAITLLGVAAGFTGQAALATLGAAPWSTHVSGRPGELTDGRITAGLDGSGDLNRNLTTGRANSSNLLRFSAGGLFTGELAADVTVTHTAAGITGQSAWATYSTTSPTTIAARTQYFDDSSGRAKTGLALGTALIVGVRNTNDVAATSSDAGATATINVPSHERKVPGASGPETRTYNSGSITGLAFGTLYFVYCDDSTFAGGAVTYVATTNSDNLVGIIGRVFVCQITTVNDGGGGGSGGGWGGGGGGGGGVIQ